MSSLDTQRAAHRSGEAGYKFIIHLKPSSSLAMTLAFRPSRTGTLQLPLPLVLHSALAAAPVSDTGDEEEQEDGSGSSAGSNLLGVPVVAQGVQPQLVLSKSSVDFGACIISRSQSQRASPYATEVYVRNNTEADVQVRRMATCATGLQDCFHSGFIPGQMLHLCLMPWNYLCTANH